tara:strand:- start:720 stop:878 length:159 start_codon:yes stop_codon:yes gene_type:complete
MQENVEKKLNPKKISNLHSNFWFWPIYSGFFLGLGIPLRKISTHQNIPQKQT